MNYPVFEHVSQVFRRIQSYPRHEVVIELLLVFVVVYAALRYLRGTRGGRAIRGLALILILATALVKFLTGENAFERLDFLYGHFLVLIALAMLVVFSPELRRLLVRLGEARLLRRSGKSAAVIDQVVASVANLSKNKIGALIAIERDEGLKITGESGVAMDAVVSTELLNTIFWPGSALHDMGVVIQDGRIVAAGVQFPLAEGEKFDPELGSRHRAAVGLSLEGDALVIAVSEETGTVSLAERGELHRQLAPEQLRDLLLRGLERRTLPTPPGSPARTEAPTATRQPPNSPVPTRGAGSDTTTPRTAAHSSPAQP